jgi:hypothetical protein
VLSSGKCELGMLIKQCPDSVWTFESEYMNLENFTTNNEFARRAIMSIEKRNNPKTIARRA